MNIEKVNRFMLSTLMKAKPEDRLHMTILDKSKEVAFFSADNATVVFVPMEQCFVQDPDKRTRSNEVQFLNSLKDINWDYTEVKPVMMIQEDKPKRTLVKLQGAASNIWVDKKYLEWYSSDRKIYGKTGTDVIKIMEDGHVVGCVCPVRYKEK